MMNNPQLLKALVNYDRNYSGRRAYDNGNIAESSATIAPQLSATDEMVSAQANTNIALLQAVNTLLQRLEQPIEAKIDMYGRGKLYDSMTKANQFMKNKWPCATSSPRQADCDTYLPQAILSSSKAYILK